MKQVAIVIGCLLAATFCFAQPKIPTADEVLRPVLAQAKKENKNVLLLYQASWCGWCRKMALSLQDKAVQPLIDQHYVTAHLTVYESKDKQYLENPGAMELLAKHGGTDLGLPYWVVLDADGKLLASAQHQPNQNTGCPANAAEVAYFVQVLKQTAPLTEAQLQTVAKRFRMNEQ